MKLVILTAITAFLFASCTDPKMEKELRELKKENVLLKSRLKKYDKALVLTKDNIHKYVGAIAYGPLEAKPNETVYISTCLTLNNWPGAVKWMTNEDNQAVNKGDKIPPYPEFFSRKRRAYIHWKLHGCVPEWRRMEHSVGKTYND